MLCPSLTNSSILFQTQRFYHTYVSYFDCSFMFNTCFHFCHTASFATTQGNCGVNPSKKTDKQADTRVFAFFHTDHSRRIAHLSSHNLVFAPTQWVTSGLQRTRPPRKIMAVTAVTTTPPLLGPCTRRSRRRMILFMLQRTSCSDARIFYRCVVPFQEVWNRVDRYMRRDWRRKRFVRLHPLDTVQLGTQRQHRAV